MSYIVLARKWRPLHFDEVVGQEHVARTLCNAIDQDRVAHAFLFCGPRGVGKTSTARILAKALNCAEGPTGKPCYACPSCEEISRGGAVDVFEIDGASNRGVGEIRELREGVRYAPNRDRHKIYIIDEVHMLTTEAFNALLKTLEEPPPHVKFIFATTEPQKIPVTILSRCQRFDFKRIPIRKIIGRLEHILAAETIDADPSALSLIARQADGGMRDALSLTDQVISFASGRLTEDMVAEILGVASRELLFRLSGALIDRRIEQALTILDEVSLSGHDLLQFAAALVSHLRDLTVVKVTGKADQMTDLTDAELETAKTQTQKVGPDVLQRMFSLTVKSADDMSRSSFPKLIFEMALVKLSAIEPLMPIELLLKRLAALESGLLIGNEDGGPPSGGGPSGPSGHTPDNKGGGGPPPNTHLHSPPSFETRSPMPEARFDQPTLRDSAPPSPEPNIVPFPTKAPAEEKPALAQTPLNGTPTPTNSTFVGEATDPAGTSTPNPSPVPQAQGPKRGQGPASKAQTDPEPRTHLPSLADISWETARSSWRQVVKRLGTASSISSAWFMQARLHSLTPGSIDLRFPEDLAGLVDADKHAPLVASAANEALAELWDGNWEVSFDIIDNGDSDAFHCRSLAAEDAEIVKARREKAREIIANHHIIAQAQEIFSPLEIKVVLEDEEFYTWDLM